MDLEGGITLMARIYIQSMESVVDLLFGQFRYDILDIIIHATVLHRHEHRYWF